MILSFSRELKIGNQPKQPTNFKNKVQTGEKVHTIRSGHRWRPGQVVHFWEGSPRNQRPPLPSEFFIDPSSPAGRQIPCWTIGEDPSDPPRVLVPAIERIQIDYTNQVQELDRPAIYIGGQEISEEDFYLLAANDGLQPDEFILWFAKEAWKTNRIFDGQIVHWTGKLYVDDQAEKSELFQEIQHIRI